MCINCFERERERAPFLMFQHSPFGPLLDPLRIGIASPNNYAAPYFIIKYSLQVMGSYF